MMLRLDFLGQVIILGGGQFDAGHVNQGIAFLDGLAGLDVDPFDQALETWSDDGCRGPVAGNTCWKHLVKQINVRLPCTDAGCPLAGTAALGLTSAC